MDQELEDRTRQAGHLRHHHRGALQLGPAQLGLAHAVRPGLLRHRDDRHHHGALRSGALRRRGVPALAAPGRPDDRLRHRDQKDGPAGGAALQPDGRAASYVIAMGACAISGGPFKQGYNVLKGIDRYIPVDVHIPGCPPRPRR